MGLLENLGGRRASNQITYSLGNILDLQRMYFAPFQSFLFCFIGKSREGRPHRDSNDIFFILTLHASPSSVTEDLQKIMPHIQPSGIFEKFFFSVETEYKMLRNRVSAHLMNNTWVLHQNVETFVFRFKTNLWL